MKKIGLLLLMTFTLATWTTVSYALQASWYDCASLRREGTWRLREKNMANEKKFDENALTCATRLYAFNTRLRITNLKNGKTVEVVVTDRIGKRFAKSRIDLSRGAFQKIANLDKGIINVKVERI